MDEDTHKAHREPHAGRKAQRKKKEKGKGGDDTAPTPKSNLRQKDEAAGSDAAARVRNPKAFAFKSSVKAAKAVHRAADLVEKKTHVLSVDRTPVEPPPVVVAVVGPPKVGKSTVVRGLVRSLTRQKLDSILGPVSIVSGKKRRLTILECPNDVNAMIDVAKVADLVLLLVDASFGLEMDTFEFLNICQVHGMPRIIGVLTHLDVIKNPKRVKLVKKTLKHRFWTEVYQGAKLFYLSGLIGDKYLANEIKNLARFISVMKFRPLQWRTTHPYILADRMEDMTEKEAIAANPLCDRSICLYGYVRGTHFRQKADAHIPGVGDVRVSEMRKLPDPCPLPDEAKKRSLDSRERVVYAPLSGVSGILYDKDAVYVQDKRRRGQAGKEERLLGKLAAGAQPLDEGMDAATMSVFKGAVPLAADDPNLRFDAPGASSSEEGEDEEMESEEEEDDGKKKRPLDPVAKKEFLDAVKDSDGSGGESDGEAWNRRLSAKASAMFSHRATPRLNWQLLVYGAEEATAAAEPEEMLGGLFRRGAGATLAEEEKALKDQRDSAAFRPAKATLASAAAAKDGWDQAEVRERIRDCFVGKDWVEEEPEDDEDLGFGSEEDGSGDESDSLYGDFEDMETKETFEAQPGAEKTEPPGEGEKEGEQTAGNDGGRDAARASKKRKLKQMFDAEYDETSKYYNELKGEMDSQAQLNKSEFEGLDDAARIELEGFRPGMYVRVEIEGVSPEFVEHFDPAYPMILGGLLSGEQNVGCLQVRIKKHRWYPKILKTRDPLTISLGWRRFQTMPLFSAADHNGRARLLKYTPEFMHCNASFWGPITPQNAGLLAFQTIKNDVKGFRIAGTGVVLNMDRSLQVMKKLKLTGTPYKVFKKSAFIKGMFSSPLEVAKFSGAGLRSVAGLRGQVKKAVQDSPGAFRATFEDKILLRDIVFLRTWYAVGVPQFYSVVDNLMRAAEERGAWEGMRTVGQLRFQQGLPTPSLEDSLYRPIVRRPFVSEELVVPGSLAKALPYALKPKKETIDLAAPKGPRGKLQTRHTAVVLEPHESKMNDLMRMLRTVKEDRVEKEKEAMNIRVGKHKEQLKAIEERKGERMKGLKKRVCRNLSKMERKKMSSAVSTIRKKH